MNQSVNLVVPMAGAGARFVEAGYSTPKPLLPVGEFKMFEVVLCNLLNPLVAEVVMVAPRYFGLKEHAHVLESRLGIPLRVLEVDSLTAGPAVSALLGSAPLDPSKPVVIANSDQFLDFSSRDWMAEAVDSGVDGSILCMRDSDPKWSYVGFDSDGLVSRVEEKKVISKMATCGVYYFKEAGAFQRYASEMIDREDRVNGEFYVGPVYNGLISEGGRVACVDLGPVSEVMYGLGIPADYERFLVSEGRSKAEEVCLSALGNIL